jgi:hypothetical protein
LIQGGLSVFTYQGSFDSFKDEKYWNEYLFLINVKESIISKYLILSGFMKEHFSNYKDSPLGTIKYESEI